MIFENSKKDEVSIWLSFINGDKNAFTTFYKIFYQKLYSYGLSFTMDEESVRDIIHELFLKLYMNPELVQDHTKIKAFLFTAFRNAYINHTAYLKKHIDIDNVDNFDLRFTIENNSLEEREEQEEIQQRIKKILDNLTTRQREIIYLRFLHQMDYEDISTIMKLSGQAARNLIYRAINSLRKDNLDIFLLVILP